MKNRTLIVLFLAFIGVVGCTSDKKQSLEDFVPHWDKCTFTNLIVYPNDSVGYLPIDLDGLTSSVANISDFEYKDGKLEANMYVPKIVPVYCAQMDGVIPLLLVPGKESGLRIDVQACEKSDNPIHDASCWQFSGELADLNEVLVTEFDNLLPLGISSWYEKGMSEEAFHDSLWNGISLLKQQYEQSAYSERQKEFIRVMLERRYVCLYTLGRSLGFSLEDKHAQELEFFRDGRTFYAISSGLPLPYLKANNVEGKMKDWMEAMKVAQSLAEKMQSATEPFPSAAFDTIPEPFRSDLLTLNDTIRNQAARWEQSSKQITAQRPIVLNGIQPNPDVAAEDLFPYFVKSHEGSVIFIDCWATWCGPCLKGIEAMKPLKKKLAGKDVVFIYLTSTTSPLNEWEKKTKEISGLHYRLSEDTWNKIKGKNGIPQYFIFDRKGKKIYERVGYGNGVLDEITDAISNALP
ncbi:MAG: TlpA family protein disulfide reductase [Bacteroidaceae bacterium]|nr:TlpA family protein disulfide reductase [Bacteroidaceae bacterium]